METSDFYMEIDISINNYLYPLISHYLPCDKYWLWKIGNSVRLDYCLSKVCTKQEKEQYSLLVNPDNNEIINREIPLQY